MIGAPIITTPAQAMREMLAAGAIFSVVRRDGALGYSFSYRVADGGDAALCRAILETVKRRPPVFLQAFRAAVQNALAMRDRGAA